MTQNPQWETVGRQIKAGRKATGLSARAAAKRAGMSATYWQDLERGHRLDGGRVQLSDKKLADAARVARVDPTDLFALVGRTYDPDAIPAEEPAENGLQQVLVEAARLAREAALEAIEQHPADVAGRLTEVELRLTRLEGQVDQMLAEPDDDESAP